MVITHRKCLHIQEFGKKVRIPVSILAPSVNMSGPLEDVLTTFSFLSPSTVVSDILIPANSPKRPIRLVLPARPKVQHLAPPFCEILPLRFHSADRSLEAGIKPKGGPKMASV